LTALYHLYLITAKKEKGNVYIGYESSTNPDIDEN
jgi:hypothetical protein